MPHEPDDEVGFVVRVGPSRTPPRPVPEEPFCIALLGDFSGRSNRGAFESGAAIAGRKPIRVDRDNLDEVLARTAPQLNLSLGDASATEVPLRFERLDDFHPDRLYERLPIFRSLRETRDRLADPALFAQTVQELAAEAPPPPQGAAPGLTPPPSGLLDQVLDKTSRSENLEHPSVGVDLRAFLRRIVAPHVVPTIDAGQSEVLARVDSAIGDVVRALLHHPDFQALEALWRAVFFLTRRIETGTQLQLHLIDVAKDELDLDLERGVEESGLYKLLVESSVGTPGGTRWSVLAGDYFFGPDPRDIELLTRLASLASQARAPWLSAAAPPLAGLQSFAQTPDPSDWSDETLSAWESLRQAPQAEWLGLALPRFLLRLPYGADTEPCEELSFEEMPAAQALHEAYLWGNPAFACAYLLAQSFSEAGWALRPGAHLEIERLPLHLAKVNGDVEAKPCAETLLTERVAQRLLEKGLMPLASFKDSGLAKLVRFQSVADPLAPLAGPWAGL